METRLKVFPLGPERRVLMRQYNADLETPLSVYLKLADGQPSFLLESVTGGEQVARYSFVGVRPRKSYLLKDGVWEIHSAEGMERYLLRAGENPLHLLRTVSGAHEVVPIPELPRFVGGLVGYLSYDVVRFFEPSVSIHPEQSWPEAIFLQADTLVAFDHAYGQLLLLTIAEGEQEMARAIERLDELETRLKTSLPEFHLHHSGSQTHEVHSNKTREEYLEMVRCAQEYIRAGDIFQVVLSQRLMRRTQAAPLDIYRALRRLNPSPYMFYFDFGALTAPLPLRLIGASPEVHVRLDGRRAMIRPIAGTRPRGKSEAEDVAIEQELRNDPKERAEHVMLVDLARNDLGRVCLKGSVHVSEEMTIERYSHVMHIVSQVEGELDPEHDAFDLLQATFPAGTVSGAPKVRAMQIIQKLEEQPRGIYAGIVGYFSYNGSMDTCITLRTLVMHGDTVYIQAGSGVVADSDPEREYQESLNKARALLVAVENAEGQPERAIQAAGEEYRKRVLLIDNYDSFTYNLAQYLGELGAEVLVFRNDAIRIEEIEDLKPTHIVISPGPGTPADAGVSNEVIRRLGPRIPILGVCLGHQCIASVFGGEVTRASRLMHGKTSLIQHQGKDLFAGLPSPFQAARYHSLIVREPLPSVLEVTATTSEGEIMGLRHKEYPIFGVQFHPESILTEYGKELLNNFLKIKTNGRQKNQAPQSVSHSGSEKEVDMLKPFLAKLLQRQNLTAEEAEQAMQIIMSGQATPAQIAGYLIALRMKGETVDEIVGSARAMRSYATPVPVRGNGRSLLDTAGTGGDGKHTFNISTAAAFVVAGTGRKVAKHGNRAASSSCGSADVLQALGVSLDLTPEQVATCIEEIGIGFIFAPRFHPAMKHAIGPRRELGQRTIFNLLGPLTNPAGATHQLIGVYDPSLTELLAEVLKELGSRGAWIVHGDGGLDELSTTGANRVSILSEGRVKTFDLHAERFGLRPAALETLRGHTPQENAALLRAILSGEDRSPRRDVVLLNAAAAIAVETGDLGSALEEARLSLDSGKALEKLEAFILITQKFAETNGAVAN
jgi:anthranilate synthase component I